MAQGSIAHRERTYPTPTRGQQAPDLVGETPQGERMSLRRSFYMRRNLGILFVADDDTGRRWLREAAEQRNAAHAEVGEIVAIVPPGMETHGLPALVDTDSSLSARYGLSSPDLPAVFVTDRYFVIFSTNTGDSATPGLLPEDIPGWLEFIAARCS
ncbi:MAG: peroxiredoxin family protein [Thermomicrobiales bacterium]|nr:peroxiredoxin family protein [Thermomicrobiales bacterium]